MAREQFIDYTFSPKSLAQIEVAQKICDDYARMGYKLTLRQLYYQFVAGNKIVNSEKSYKNLGGLINNARMAGLLDWAIIEDRTRVMQSVSHWNDPNAILDACARSFRIDKWEDQANWVIVMVEKQALEGVLIPICRELDVPFLANRGYASASTFYDLGKLIGEMLQSGRDAHIIYLGDHDPSGIDMGRDVEERLTIFSRGCVTFHRIALNMNQIEQYSPPENPAKLTDSRATAYIDRFGDSSWELDALRPDVLANLIRTNVRRLRDDTLWEQSVAREEKMRLDLSKMAETYTFDTDEE